MDQAEVGALYDLLDAMGVEIWLDGGWGIDALIGEQTRTHDDLDIAIHRIDVPTLRALLDERGYREIARDDTTEWNFVLSDDHGHEVDVHAFEHDPAGNLTYGIAYPTEALTGAGVLGGKPVRCIALDSVVAFHCAYEPRPKDVQDMRLLRDHFGIDVPEAYRTLIGRDDGAE